MTPLERYFFTVLRDRPVRRVISRMVRPSRRCQRRITLNIATLITPLSPAQALSRTVSTRGSILDANYPVKWVSFRRKSTVMPSAAGQQRRETALLNGPLHALVRSQFSHLPP